MWVTILWISTLNPAATTAPAPTGDRATVIIVVGAEGEPEYGREFAASANRWRVAVWRASA